MADTVFSVSQISEYIEKKLLFDPMLAEVSVRGEVTNHSLSSRGQVYFSIKDDLAQINCVVFDRMVVSDMIQNGAMVIVSGEIGYYKKAGRINLIVKSIKKEGEGDLYAAFLMTKEKLEAEGLFDASHKKPLPPYSIKIGVITSAAGAAMHDVIQVATRRFDGITVKVYPASVQGAEASATLISGIDYFNQKDLVDLIIIGRGGGSFEDLFAFNDAMLARKIYNSEIPVVSAVGHEVDYTICDFVADFRAPTPSAAAELCIPKKSDIKNEIQYYRERLGGLLDQKITAAISTVTQKRLKLAQASPEEKLNGYATIIGLNKQKLMNRMDGVVIEAANAFNQYRNKLTDVSPAGVLNRGFAFIADKSGKAVRQASGLKKGDAFTATFADGSIAAEVTQGRKEAKNE